MKMLPLLSFILPVIAVAGETIPLFNGKDLSGWTMDTPVHDEAGPEDQAKINNGILTIDTHTAEWWKSVPSFIVRDGVLVSLGEPRGHLVTEAAFADYELVVEYRFTKTPGNCGVLVHASEPRRLYKMFPQSIEVQMMHENAGDFWCIGENIEVPEMGNRRPRKDDSQQFGGDAGDARRIMNLVDGVENPPGSWNTMTIRCQGDEIIVHVNGTMVNHGFNSTATSGKIALQAEGSEVEFRKVELTSLAE